MVFVYYHGEQLLGPIAIGLVARGQTGIGYCWGVVGFDGRTDASSHSLCFEVPESGMGVNQSLKLGIRPVLRERWFRYRTKKLFEKFVSEYFGLE